MASGRYVPSLYTSLMLIGGGVTHMRAGKRVESPATEGFAQSVWPVCLQACNSNDGGSIHSCPVHVPKAYRYRTQ
jgi:hypothetical protein